MDKPIELTIHKLALAGEQAGFSVEHMIHSTRDQGYRERGGNLNIWRYYSWTDSIT
jgi:hypothetical protein